MRRLALFLLVGATFPPAVMAASVPPGSSLRYFFPGDAITYAEEVPAPEPFFGFSIGDWHLQHHQLLAYCEALAEAAPERVLIERTGRTHGNREKFLVTISSPENLRRLEEIRAANLRNALGTQPVGADAPVVVLLGYSIHGNEPSGANAAPLIAYHLAAGRGPAVDTILHNTVVLIDPALNPDGLDRFAAWANDHRGRIANPDPSHLEHTEPWPGGRTNAYWFDLNRDWLPAVQPETKAHLDTFHDWRPAIVADFHEMSPDGTYFFQPGIPEQANPLIPPGNQDLTRAISHRHAAALDAIGSLYFTEERFDDFYIGKGSTYPDINGSVGILFEQASARGHIQDSPNGPVSLRSGVRNHVQTTLSTLSAAVELRHPLLEHQYTSARTALADAAPSGIEGYLFTAGGDEVRLASLTRLLELHRIDFRILRKEVVIGEMRFPPKTSIYVSSAQPTRRLITAMFEKRTEFASQAFYDTSAWNVAEAFALQRIPVRDKMDPDFLGAAKTSFSPEATAEISPESIALAFDWSQHHAPRAAYRLGAVGLRIRAALTPFSADTPHGRREFPAGSIVVPFSIQEMSREELVDLARRISEEDAVNIYGVRSGLTPSGIDLGSPGFRPVDTPRILLVAGGKASAYRTGEIWHLLDRELGIPVTLIDPSRLDAATLARHNVILFAGSRFDVNDPLRRRVERGATLIVMGDAIRSLASTEAPLVPIDLGNADFPEQPVNFADARAHSARTQIEGAIVAATADLTHPIAFGLASKRLPVFRECEVFLNTTKNPYSSPVRYTDSPVVSGYISEPNQKALAGTAAVQIHHRGQGRVILMPDAPAFRGYWHGSERLLLNAIFFGPLMKEETVTSEDGDAG